MRFLASISAKVVAAAHRGQDNQDSFVDETIALRHTQLAIIDMSPAGKQPTRSPDGRKIIVYNDESYNFRELRRDHEKRREPERALVGLRVGKMTEVGEAWLGVEPGDNGDA
ncbi:glutamine amidotransferase-like protein [Methylosinus sp. sav-2]|nr:glutamine amidotransferase-like protein [Methylosinus sp. sav-2]